MTIILLAAGVPLAAGSVLGSALSADGNPGATMRAELVALAVTLPGLVLLLPDFGGVGAAVVSGSHARPSSFHQPPTCAGCEHDSAPPCLLERYPCSTN